MRPGHFIACFGLVACGVTSTTGEMHRATFSYGGCVGTCSVDQPMMVGTEETIHVAATPIPAVTVTSSAPSIVAVHDVTRGCCDTLDVRVMALSPGVSDFTLATSDGSTFDSVRLRVDAPKSLTLTCGSSSGAVTLARGATCAIAWTAARDDGAALRTSTGVTLSSTNADVVLIQPFLGVASPTVEASQGLFGPQLVAEGPGDASIQATALGAATTLNVHVTP